MHNSYLDHPAEEALERFLLQQCPDEELETVETHILGCGSCVSRLEALESQIADLRIGFEALQREQAMAVAAKQHRSWKTWFTVPNLAWAGAAAAVVIGLALTPELVRHPTAPADITLIAYRGSENAVAPEDRRLNVHLDASGLSQATSLSQPNRVALEMVNEDGTQLLSGYGLILNHQVQVSVPKITQPGTYFFRLYAVGTKNEKGELLREFALQVK